MTFRRVTHCGSVDEGAPPLRQVEILISGINLTADVGCGVGKANQ